jgi:hypothetical protein
MIYQEAQELSLKVEWKTTLCLEGEKCWCRIIEPLEPIFYDEDETLYIAGSGCIPTIYAEHIVKLHNQSLK